MMKGMSSQLRAMGELDRSLEGLEQGQQRVAVGVDKQVEGLQQLQSQAVNLDEQLTVVIRNEVRLSSQTIQILCKRMAKSSNHQRPAF